MRYTLGMNDIQHIITERVDDIPLRLEQMPRMELPTLIDHAPFLDLPGRSERLDVMCRRTPATYL